MVSPDSLTAPPPVLSSESKKAAIGGRSITLPCKDSVMGPWTRKPDPTRCSSFGAFPLHTRTGLLCQLGAQRF